MESFILLYVLTTLQSIINSLFFNIILWNFSITDKGTFNRLVLAIKIFYWCYRPKIICFKRNVVKVHVLYCVIFFWNPVWFPLFLFCQSSLTISSIFIPLWVIVAVFTLGAILVYLSRWQRLKIFDQIRGSKLDVFLIPCFLNGGVTWA